MIGDRIKEIRLKHGLNQSELSQKIGFTQAAISAYEKGIRTPTEPVVKILCQEFGVSRAWLVDGEGEMLESSVPSSHEEEIAAYIGEVLRPSGETFQKQFISMLAKLSDEEWLLMEKMVHTMMEEIGHPDFMNEKKPDGE